MEVVIKEETQKLIIGNVLLPVREKFLKNKKLQEEFVKRG